MIRNVFGLLFIIVFLLGMTASKHVFAQQLPGFESVRFETEKINAQPGMFHAAWGLAVIEAETGKIVFQYNSQLALVPASTLKLMTTYPAWLTLGPSFQFSTYLQIDGKVTDSTLKGSVYIKGDGDPCLGTTRIPACEPNVLLYHWMNTINKLGIKKIEGAVIADAAVFTDELIPGEWLWNDIGNYYGAGASGLNFHENSLDFFFQPGEKEGMPAKLKKMDPLLHELVIDNQVTTGKKGSGDQVIIYGSPYSANRMLRGTVPLGEKDFIVSGCFPDPPLATAEIFSQYLKTNDIVVIHDPTTTSLLNKNGTRVSQNRTNLDTVHSPKMIELIQWIHHKSINCFAEALVKKLGQTQKQQGSTQAGLDFIKDFWKEKGLDFRGITMVDGSGLSPLNRISAIQMAKVMSIIANDKNAADFIQTLSLGGKSGDLKGILTDGPASGKLRGKSGFMKNVRSYSGIVRNKAGKNLVFAVMVNNFDGDSAALRKMLESLMQGIAASGE
ncbi:MAG: D-alanyl-D-alanine carboxypeptidase/D-alanyl-D-alanine-endopeptidase [Bacteroidota bacterium]